MKDGSFIIALAIQGKKLDSVAFSQKIGTLGLHGVSDIGFVIGGSLGLSDAVLSRADMLLSFSPSVDEGDFAGAGVPCVPDQQR